MGAPRARERTAEGTAIADVAMADVAMCAAARVAKMGTARQKGAACAAMESAACAARERVRQKQRVLHASRGAAATSPRKADPKVSMGACKSNRP